ncbi:MAG: acetate/propionate family kinase [Actinomycetota bacterium]
MRVLVVNAGSSSLKLRVLDDRDELAGSADLPAPRGESDRDAARTAIEGFGPVDVVGHRIVHGGTEFSEPVLIDDRVRRRLHALVDLAPLHQPKSLAALEAVDEVLPDVPAVACFDTAFHAGMPAAAATYALPRQWRERWSLRRFGFHGLSHAYVSRRAAELAGIDVADARVVTCHLGAGASLAAVRGGRSVDTTMGFTPLEGLAMATRSGTVDPGLVLWLQEHAGMPAAELAATLEHRSGLEALAGTGDMKEVVALKDSGDADATLAFDVYVHRIRSGVAAMAASAGGLDVLAFAGGVGEHAPAVRAAVGEGLAFLGASFDEERDANAVPDADIGAAGAPVRAFVVAAREDLEIARQSRSVLGSA